MNSDIINHFSERANYYDLPGGWVKNDNILSSITNYMHGDSNRISNILDLGAGTGALSMHILKECSFRKQIFAIDISSEMLAKITSPQISVHRAFAENLPFENDFFDIIVSRQCLHYIENLNMVISEIKRTLKNGGAFILSQIVPLDTETKEEWIKLMRFRQPLRKHFFTEREWSLIFEAEGFQIEGISRLTHKTSVKKWAEIYNINDQQQIEIYKDFLLNQMSDNFKEEYKLIHIDDDIQYMGYWVTIEFKLV